MNFESEESCRAAKDAMEDCEIDGSKVTVEFTKSAGGPQSTGGGSADAHRGTPERKDEST